MLSNHVKSFMMIRSSQVKNRWLLSAHSLKLSTRGHCTNRTYHAGSIGLCRCRGDKGVSMYGNGCILFPGLFGLSGWVASLVDLVELTSWRVSYSFTQCFGSWPLSSTPLKKATVSQVPKHWMNKPNFWFVNFARSTNPGLYWHLSLTECEVSVAVPLSCCSCCVWQSAVAAMRCEKIRVVDPSLKHIISTSQSIREFRSQ